MVKRVTHPFLNCTGLFEVEHGISTESFGCVGDPVWGGPRKGQRAHPALHELEPWYEY